MRLPRPGYMGKGVMSRWDERNQPKKGATSKGTKLEDPKRDQAKDSKKEQAETSKKEQAEIRKEE